MADLLDMITVDLVLETKLKPYLDYLDTETDEEKNESDPAKKEERRKKRQERKEKFKQEMKEAAEKFIQQKIDEAKAMLNSAKETAEQLITAATTWNTEIVTTIPTAIASAAMDPSPTAKVAIKSTLTAMKNSVGAARAHIEEASSKVTEVTGIIQNFGIPIPAPVAMVQGLVDNAKNALGAIPL